MIGSFVTLSPKEEIVAVIRRSFWPELYRLTFGVLWMLTPFFFFFPLIHIGVIGVISFCVILISGVLFFLRQWSAWRFMVLIVTNERVIDVDQQGIRRRVIHEVPLADVEKIRVYKDSRLGSLFGLRTLRIETSIHQEFDIEFSGVPRAKHVKELILEVKSLSETDNI